MSEVPKYWTRMWVTNYVRSERRSESTGERKMIYSCDILRKSGTKPKWNHMLWGRIDENILTECIHGGSIDRGIVPNCADCPLYKNEILGVIPRKWFQRGLRELKRDRNRAVITTADYDPKKPTIVQMRRDRGKK